MGSLPSTLGKVVFETAEKGLQSLGQKYAGSAVEGITAGTEMAISKMFSLNSTLTGKSGAFLTEHLTKFQSEFDKQLAIGTAQAKQQGLAGQIPQHVIETQARKTARNHVFGNNDEIISAAVHAKALEHGDESAKNLVDNLGVYFHEHARQSEDGSYRPRLTTNLRRNKTLPPTPVSPTGGSSLAADIDFDISPYNKRKFFNNHPGIEPWVHTLASASLAFKAGLAHTTTPLNGLLGNSLMSFAKASTSFFGDGYKDAKIELQTYNALGSIWAEELGQMYKFRNGLIAKYAPGSIGEFLHQNFLIPGFTALRQRTATMFAMQGKFSAMEYAADLMSGDPDKIRKATKQLEWLGINAHDVMNRGGQLVPEQIRQAMFENANQKMFIQSGGMNRSSFATANALGRLTSMYHGYGAAQANFIQRELVKAYQLKDPIGMAKTLAVLGMVFPAVGYGVHALEGVWMHPSKAGEKMDEAKENIKELVTSPDIMNRLEGISNVAGFGVMSSYTRAAGRRKLINSMAGPAINAASEVGEDLANIHPSKDATKGEYDVKTWEPLARDLMHDIPSLGIGSWFADKYFPSQKELNKEKPMTSRRLAAQKSAARKKARKGD